MQLYIIGYKVFQESCSCQVYKCFPVIKCPCLYVIYKVHYVIFMLSAYSKYQNVFKRSLVLLSTMMLLMLSCLIENNVLQNSWLSKDTSYVDFILIDYVCVQRTSKYWYLILFIISVSWYGCLAKWLLTR